MPEVSVEQLVAAARAYVARAKGGESFTVVEGGRVVARLAADVPWPDGIAKAVAQGRLRGPELSGPRSTSADAPPLELRGAPLSTLLEECGR